MAVTNKKELDIRRNVNVFLQSGNVGGLTSSNYPMNISDVIMDSPNTEKGPTSYPVYPVNSVYDTYVVGVTGDYSNRVKTGDPVTIIRGEISNSYVVKSNLYNPDSDINLISLFVDRETTRTLDAFLGASGYNYASDDTFIVLNPCLEHSDDVSTLVSSFSCTVLPSLIDTFSLVVSWELDPIVKSTKLRWRSVPRNYSISTLDFYVGATGYYTEVPAAVVNSLTGRSAIVQLKASVYEINLADGGTGYSYASAQVVGDGSGASLSVSLSGTSVSSVNVDLGGTGYSYAPRVILSGDGYGASVSNVVMEINTVETVQQGGGYLTSPSVTVDPTYLAGTASVIYSTLSLANEGRVDYIRLDNGGSGYTGASVIVTGSHLSDESTAVVTVEDGVIKKIDVTYGGHGYTAASVAVVPDGTGSGATAAANIDIYSKWVYEDALYTEKTITIDNFHKNIPYEIQILASADDKFRGTAKYSKSFTFQY